VTNPKPASWLFVLGEESIWVMHAAARTMFIYGPGALQQCFRFSTDAARDAYQISMTERLISDGWVLWGVDRDRRQGADRRQVAREGSDRRSADVPDPTDQES
jgi:hypothetical protein